MITLDLVTEETANEIIYNVNTRASKAAPCVKFLKAVTKRAADVAGVEYMPVWRIVRRNIECV